MLIGHVGCRTATSANNSRFDVGTVFHVCSNRCSSNSLLGIQRERATGDGTSVASRPTASQYVLDGTLGRPLAVTNGAQITAARDGLILARYLLGMRSLELIRDIEMGDAQRIDAGQMAGYLAAIVPLLDVDGDSNISVRPTAHC